MAQSIPQNVILGLRSMLLGESRERSQDDEDGKSNASSPEGLTPIDIVITRIMLSKGTKLPPDVVDVIFDFAEYWAHSSNEIDYMLQHSENLLVNGQSPAENKFLVSRSDQRKSVDMGLTRIASLVPCGSDGDPRQEGTFRDIGI
ncbi:hypothetical protein ACHAPU_006435 [Fusarium lateritium]